MNYSEVIMVVYFDEGVTGEKERAIEAFNNAQKLATGIEMKKNDISGGVKYLASWKAEDDYGTGRQYAIKMLNEVICRLRATGYEVIADRPTEPSYKAYKKLYLDAINL